MAIRAFSLFGEVELRTAKLHSGVRDASKSFKQLETDSRKSIAEVNKQISSMGSGMSKAGDFISRTGANILGNLATDAISGAVDKMKSLTEQGMGYYDSVQMSRMAFKGLAGDQGKADAHLRDLLKFSRSTPFDDQPVIQYALGLESVGVKAQEVTKYLTGMGNALAGSGSFTIDHQKGLLKSLKDMLGKPTLMAEEVKGQLPEHVASGMADFAAALGLSQEQFTDRMGKGEIKSRPAVELLIDYWNKQKAGLMQFAGENTFAGLKSSKDSAEAASMANIFAGGDVMNPSAAGAGAGYLTLLREQIARRDKFGQGGPAQEALGALATKYLKSREADDAMFFSLAENTDFMSRFAQDLAKQPDQAGGLPLPTAAGASLFNTIFGKDARPVFDMPRFQKDGSAQGLVPDAFRSITGTSINEVEKGAGPMQEAGKLLGEALFKGIDVTWLFGSPSKKAIQLGLWINEGLEIGLTKGQGRNYANMKALSQADPNFIKTLVAQSAKRGVNPDDMLNLIGIESAFNKSVMNKHGYAGLGQVGRDERAALGLAGAGKGDDAKFKQMLSGNSASWQLENVLFPFLDMKLRENKGVKSGGITLAELYAMWGSGHATGNPNAIHMAKGGKRSLGYDNNPLWDANKDGVVREGEFGIAAARSLGAGQFFSINGKPGVSDASPMPVSIVGTIANTIGGVAGMLLTGGTGSASGIVNPQVGGWAGLNLPIGVGGSGSVSMGGANKAIENIKTWAATPTVADLPIGTLKTADLLRALPAQQLGLLVGGTLSGSTSVTSNGLTTDEVARKRLEALGSPTAATSQREKKAFGWEGVAGDFQGGLVNMLGNMGWEKPGSLGKQFLIGMLRDIQGRLAQDTSAMITGSLFGGGTDGKMSGGLLQKLFGGLFGGGRASGGSMSAGRLYMAGEHGPEAIWMGGSSGYAYNNRETRGMMGGGGEQRVIVYMGPDEFNRAIDHDGRTPRGRRTKFVNAKWGRKLQSVSY